MPNASADRSFSLSNNSKKKKNRESRVENSRLFFSCFSLLRRSRHVAMRTCTQNRNTQSYTICFSTGRSTCVQFSLHVEACSRASWVLRFITANGVGANVVVVVVVAVAVVVAGPPLLLPRPCVPFISGVVVSLTGSPTKLESSTSRLVSPLKVQPRSHSINAAGAHILRGLPPLPLPLLLLLRRRRRRPVPPVVAAAGRPARVVPGHQVGSGPDVDSHLRQRRPPRRLPTSQSPNLRKGGHRSAHGRHRLPRQRLVFAEEARRAHS